MKTKQLLLGVLILNAAAGLMFAQSSSLAPGRTVVPRMDAKASMTQSMMLEKLKDLPEQVPPSHGLSTERMESFSIGCSGLKPMGR